MTRTHALLIRFVSHPDEKTGIHPRFDTVAGDVVRAIEAIGYEEVEVVSQDIHPR